MNRANTALKKTVVSAFAEAFNSQPDACIQAPGRVNLIGDHTDYNHGFVLPMAIDRYVIMAIKKRSDSTIHLTSLDFNDTINLNTHHLNKREHEFENYISGCFWALQHYGYQVRGFDGVLASSIPIGASLSSSAALEMAVLRAAAFSSGFNFDPIRMAKIAQMAENQWVGMNCGIMDQLISAVGQAGHAIRIDCADLSLQACPLPSGVQVVTLDTTTRRKLVDSAYNIRREQCFAGAQKMGLPHLRDANATTLKANKAALSAAEYQRSRHVLLENERVLAAAAAMQANDAKRLGTLMDESHQSLRDDYEVTNRALDLIVDCSQKQNACLGARMTGAGFGGCAVALVASDATDRFSHTVTACYQKQTGFTPKIYLFQPSEGVTLQQL